MRLNGSVIVRWEILPYRLHRNSNIDLAQRLILVLALIFLHGVNFVPVLVLFHPITQARRMSSLTTS